MADEYAVRGLDVSAREHLAAIVASGRVSKGWSLRQMEEATGISIAEISRLEHAQKADLYLSVLLTLQKAFSVASIEELIGDFPSYRLLRRPGEGDQQAV